MNRLRDWFDDVFIVPAVAPLSLAVALSTTLWGAWFLAPWWDSFSVSPAYAPIKDLIPEWLFGLAAMCCGLIHLIGLATRNYQLRRWGSFLTFMARLFTLVLVTIGSQGASPGIGDFSVWTLAAALVFLRVKTLYGS